MGFRFATCTSCVQCKIQYSEENDLFVRTGSLLVSLKLLLSWRLRLFLVFCLRVETSPHLRTLSKVGEGWPQGRQFLIFSQKSSQWHALCMYKPRVNVILSADPVGAVRGRTEQVKKMTDSFHW